MPMPHFFDPTMYGIELIYTSIVVLFCILIYYKTRESYTLTKYKGIKYFRNAFLFFGLAYLTRFILHLTMLTTMGTDGFLARHEVFPLMMLITSYLSTMAIFYITYSLIWKKIKYSHFFLVANIVAITLSLIAFISRSPILTSLLQLVLLGFSLVVSYVNHNKGKGSGNVRLLYLLVAIFWLINLFVLEPRHFIPLEIKIPLQLLSLFVFVAIYYKVHKWLK